MADKYKNCQSCSMPLNKDPQGGGTNSDGSRSIKYCSYCFENGKFTNPDISVEEMQAFVKEKLQEMHFPSFIAGFFTKGIPKLERWRNK